jgi:cellulose synthase/poly-beta-1,6-N-acetylglucosamine synthase-like glycosyltransferase
MPAALHPSITAIVPVRDEERAIETCVRSLAAQPEIAEIRVVNDGSSDRTAEILSRLAAEIPQLRVLQADPLPSGWVGKNHAAWLGAKDASTEWLLFTDADVRHLPGSARLALVLAHGSSASLLSFSPRQLMETWWERAMIPFVFTRLAAQFSYFRVNDPRAPDAAANGQYLLIRTDAYQAIGGHRAVASEVLEDVALAHRAKAAGLILHFAPGAEIAETRMYATFPAMWQGWTKNLYPLVGGTPSSAALELLRVVPVAALVMFALALWFPLAAPVGAFLIVLALLRYALDLRQHRFSASCIQYWLPGLVLYAAALVVSAGRYSAGSVAWKGRTYPVCS